MSAAADGRLTVLICSPLEPEEVARIAAADPARIEVLFEPELLPVPRYVADHNGIPPALDGGQLARWRGLLRRADVLFDFDWLEPERLPVTAPNVRWIQASSSGIGEFLARTGLADSAIAITTAAGLHGVPLAEFVALGLLYLTKEVPHLREWQAGRRWERHTSRELAGQRMLLVGLGQVGRQIAATCAGLGLEVWGMRRTVSGSLPPGVAREVPRSALREALAEVDALVLACPYTRETHHLIGTAEFAVMRASSIVVNVARGPVIDEPALIAALHEGRVAGAVLDVFEQEPLPPDSPLWVMPNVLVSPHSASTVAAENGRLIDLFVDNLRRYLAGEPLRNRFDPSRAY